MDTSPHSSRWFSHLQAVAPPVGVLYAGAGSEPLPAPLVAVRSPRAILIDADEGCHVQLADVINEHPGWSAHAVLLSNEEHQLDFYVASNPAESGVIPPDRLTGVWRNLKTHERRRAQATTLDRFLSSQGISEPDINWAVIDCLPALPILQGGASSLRAWDVVIVRVLLDETLLPGLGAGKAEVDDFLASNGFRCLGWAEERHPAVGMVFYLRDWKAQSEEQAVRWLTEQKQASQQLAHQCELLASAEAESQRRIQDLTSALEEQGRIAAQKEEHTAALSIRCAELTQQLEHVRRDCEQHTATVSEVRSRLQVLSDARDEQAALAAQRLRQSDDLGATCAELKERIARLTGQLQQRDKQKECLEIELREARQTAALSVKLQALREADLRELQGRYEFSVAARERQHDLLTQLSARLGAAAIYVNQLATVQLRAESQPASSAPQDHEQIGTASRKAARRRSNKP